MELTNLIGQVLDEKYRIEKQLGKGGMGAVYFATHLGTERPVALKVIAPQFMKNDEFVERFKREARAAGRLRNPNVVDVTDFGFAQVGADRVAYLVMEYLDGCTLDEVLAEEKRLPLSWVLDIMEQACSAVHEAHLQGIVHRDLKPDNIWLEPNRRGGYTIKVLDFGIAKLDDAATRLSGATLVERLLNDGENATSSLPQGLHAPSSSSSSAQTSPVPRQTTAPTPQSTPPARPTSSTPFETEGSEAGTLLLPRPSVASEELMEAGTQLLPARDAATAPTVPADEEEERTRIYENRTTNDQYAGATASVGSSLTRVGSIMGTPLYMSPEQCRGAVLDSRTDIYSLGVIAYRMLMGRPPFEGDMTTVMRHHMETLPPPLIDKKIPIKVAAVIWAALSKDPNNRPPSAAAFASALRAQSEGVGTLLRRSLTLYTEHLPTFLRLALVVYLPLILITIVQQTFNVMAERGTIGKISGAIISACLSLLLMVVSFFTASVLVGVTTRLVTQLLARPLSQVSIRSAFSYLRRRLRPFLTTTMLVNIMGFVGFALCVLPGLYVFINYALVAPVLMMEDVKGRAALRRAKTLAQRSLKTLIAVIFIHVGIPVILALIIAFLVFSVFRAVKVQISGEMFSLVYQMIYFPISILLASLASIVTALLYLKTRQAGGETLNEALGQFEEEELPRSNWQLRVRERLHTSMKTTR